MANKPLFDRVKMSVSGTPGTGAITLGSAAAAYRSFSDAGVQDGDVVSYLIVQDGAAEVGKGVYTASGTSLSRDTVIWSTAGGTTKIGVTSAAFVFITALAQDLVQVDSAGRVGIGVSAPTALLDVNSDKVRLRTSKSLLTASDAGNAGDICWDSNYLYVCVATDTWKRAALSTWAAAPWSWDPVNKSANIVLSNGNLTATTNMIVPPFYHNIVGTYSIAEPDKVMFSLTFTVSPTDGGAGFDAFGLATAAFGATDGSIGYTTTSVGAYSGDGVYYNGAYAGAVASFDTSGSVIDVCLDTLAMKFWYRINGGDWNGDAPANPATVTGGYTLTGPTLPIRPAVENYTEGVGAVRSWTINTAAVYGVPDGFKFLYGEAVV